jgi:hypothetical protein
LRIESVRNHVGVAADPAVRSNGYITKSAACGWGTVEQGIVRPPDRFGGQETPASEDILKLGQHTEVAPLENGLT